MLVGFHQSRCSRHHINALNGTNDFTCITPDAILLIGGNWRLYFLIPSDYIDKTSVYAYLAPVAYVQINFYPIHGSPPGFFSSDFVNRWSAPVTLEKFFKSDGMSSLGIPDGVDST
jgi:hypothetical protein